MVGRVGKRLPLLVDADAIESFGIPVPGETALVAFGVLASQGHYLIAIVIALAAAGARSSVTTSASG